MGTGMIPQCHPPRHETQVKMWRDASPFWWTQLPHLTRGCASVRHTLHYHGALGLGLPVPGPWEPSPASYQQPF